MRPFSLLALAASAKLVAAHTTVFAVWINDEDQGLGNTDDGYIRSPPSNSPVQDVTSTDMTCNVNGDQAAAKTLEVAAGDKITFEWHHNSRDSSDDIIASSHKGPVMVYMAPTEKGSAGSNWVKIYEDGYNDGTWAVDTLIEDKGKHSVTVPDVPAGNYLFRPEIIALHSASSEGGAQFYMECVQFKVTSDGSETLPEGVSIPGTYSADDPGILFNLYGDFDSYDIPGPDVWSGASSGSSSGSGSSGSSAEKSSTSAAASTTAASTTAAQTTTAAAAPTQTQVETQTSTATSTSTFATSMKPTTTAVVVPTSTAAPTQPAASGSAGTGSGQQYQQCGGINFKGTAGCASGLTCKQWNPYYHQCV